MTKKIISILLSMLMVMSVCAAALAENTDGSGDVQTQDGAAVESDDTSQTDASAEDAAESGETDNGIGQQLQAITKDMLSAASDRYFEYRESVAGSAAGTDDIIIQGEDFVDYASTDVQVYANGDFEYTGEKSAAAYTGESSMAVWSFDVASSGLYNIKVAYTTESSRERTAERAVYIDGCIPFTDFSSVSFERVWTDIFQEEDQGYGENRFEIDSIGSEIRPSSTIVDGMIVKTLSSGDGTDIEIYLEAGNHSIIFESLKETLVIDYIEICHDDDLPSYSDYISGCESKGDSYYNGESIKIEAEQMTTKSIFSIYASSDRTNSSVSPASSGGTTLNIIGTSAWSSNGEWVEWTVDAPSDGLYTVAVKYRQSSSEGLYVSRKVYINGEVPFKEAQAVRFEYADSWTLKRLGDANGNVYYFHLNKGENTIRLEVTQGDMFNVTEELT
ncbi:MAG: hypothetical protein ACI4QV_02690, partial [Acutalibacteraceae bacterium]